MYTNVNLAAPLGALAFLGTAFLLFAIAVVLVYSLVARRFKLTRFASFGLMLIGGVYLTLIFAFSIISHESVLALGQEKHFCELDCHLAYSIASVEQSKTLANGPNQLTAGGQFTVVQIRTRFDETTISPTRGNGQLYPNSRFLSVVDDEGRRYPPSAEGQMALEHAGAAGTPLTTPLRPGESYTTTVVFDLPPGLRNPTLLLNEGEWITHLVIGHENSWLHKKTRFQI